MALPPAMAGNDPGTMGFQRVVTKTASGCADFSPQLPAAIRSDFQLSGRRHHSIPGRLVAQLEIRNKHTGQVSTVYATSMTEKLSRVPERQVPRGTVDVRRWLGRFFGLCAGDIAGRRAGPGIRLRVSSSRCVNIDVVWRRALYCTRVFDKASGRLADGVSRCRHWRNTPGGANKQNKRRKQDMGYPSYAAGRPWCLRAVAPRAGRVRGPCGQRGRGQ